MNQQIRVEEVRLINESGEQVGVITVAEALKHAKVAGLDLVEISPAAKPPVCRIMDFGKYQFEQSKRRSGQKKKQKQTQVKEVKFRPATDVGDFKIKVDRIRKFLERGDRVKVTVRFRGREMQHRELGMDVLQRVRSALPEELIVEQEPQLEGRQITMMIILGKNG